MFARFILIHTFDPFPLCDAQSATGDAGDSLGFFFLSRFLIIFHLIWRGVYVCVREHRSDKTYIEINNYWHRKQCYFAHWKMMLDILRNFFAINKHRLVKMSRGTKVMGDVVAPSYVVLFSNSLFQSVRFTFGRDSHEFYVISSGWLTWYWSKFFGINRTNISKWCGNCGPKKQQNPNKLCKIDL